MSTSNEENKPKPTHNVEQLEPDANEAAEFSDIGSSIESDLTSLSSTVLEHVYENGRRYHSLNAGKYVMPNDESEQDRLDMFHHATSIMLGGALHVVKLPSNLHRVLDLGTGTGIWAIDMADSHPEAQVIGVDLSPIQPAWVPPNCTFEVDDVEKPWLWKEPFDFIHSANIARGIHDWPTYARRIFENLTPGGVVQLHESHVVFQCDDNSIPAGGAIETHCARFVKAAEATGLKNNLEDLAGFLIDAGFEDVKVVIKKLPLAPWPKDPKKKDLGRWGNCIASNGMKAYCLALFTNVLGMTLEEANRSCDEAYKEVCKREVHAYTANWFVEGRKPETT